MCGIAGIFDYRGHGKIDRALLRRMTDILGHRGPDGEGFHFAPGLGLGHRRLAIVDLAAGDQPLFNEDGTVCVVYNGEIYNFQPLMAELMALGHVFRTRCDTEVIVHAWEEWGRRVSIVSMGSLLLPCGTPGARRCSLPATASVRSRFITAFSPRPAAFRLRAEIPLAEPRG